MEILVFSTYIIAFILAVIMHEIAHGFVANYFGDDTARISGRLSFNPIVHIDPIGSVLVPLMLVFSGSGFLFGWAKPVPVNPFRLKGGAISYRYVTLAGIVTNIILAVTSALILKFTTQFMGFGYNNLGVIFFTVFLQINLVLAVFNSLPLPGFDGYNFLATFRPVAELIRKTPLANPIFMAQYGLFISLLLIFVFSSHIGYLFNLFFGLFLRFFGL